MAGIVYILTNPAMDGYVKIGQTENLPRRLRELDNTSTPLPFECVFAMEVEDANMVETRLHDAFADRRTRTTREFFEINPERVVSALRLTNGTEVTPSEDIVEDDESRRALTRTNKMRDAFNFSMVSIPPGTILEYIHDSSITCEVLDNKQILFNGSETTLSGATRTLYQEGGSSRIAFAGPRYWCFDGESMSERRRRMEQED